MVLPNRRPAAGRCTPLLVRLVLALIVVLLASDAATAFPTPLQRPPHSSMTARTIITPTSLHVFGKKNKKNDEDLSYIETRDMTRAEMEALNRKNEDIMNAEIAGMTIFSLILSLPLLYLAWVGFFSETAEIAGDLSPYTPQ